MLDRAVAAMKENKQKALDMFNKGRRAASRTVTSTCSAPMPRTAFSPRIPARRVNTCRTSSARKGYPLGKEIMQKATEGRISEVSYWWPRPGSDKPLEKHTFYTKVTGQNCGVGYYKE
jgi:hypothetical protein